MAVLVMVVELSLFPVNQFLNVNSIGQRAACKVVMCGSIPQTFSKGEWRNSGAAPVLETGSFGSESSTLSSPTNDL